MPSRAKSADLNAASTATMPFIVQPWLPPSQTGSSSHVHVVYSVFESSFQSAMVGIYQFQCDVLNRS